MKSSLIVAVFAMLFISIAGCKTATLFESPNNLSNITGTLYLKNGKQVNGKLTIMTENYVRTVKIFPTGEDQSMKYFLQDVAGYETRGSFYALKKIRGFSSGNEFSFMKRLTPANSKLNLYENIETQSNTGRRFGSTGPTRYDNSYYMQLPNESPEDVWELNNSKFTPNFDEKMSKIVADCPKLATKIANKEDGYFYKQVTAYDEKRLEVLMNIISEYNNCK